MNRVWLMTEMKFSKSDKSSDKVIINKYNYTTETNQILMNDHNLRREDVPNNNQLN